MDTFLLPQRLEVNNLFSLFACLKEIRVRKICKSYYGDNSKIIFYGGIEL
nr:MAG TPA: hypothetical protein [Caudoviricetes sp.]